MRENNTSNLSAEDEQRFNVLFNRLDINRDGKIDVLDLINFFKEWNLGYNRDIAQKVIDRHDSDNDGHMDFEDFVTYIQAHEKMLRLTFDHVDHNQDGIIDKKELQETFKKLGAELDQIGAQNMLKRMDKDETLTINPQEWRDYFLFRHMGTHLADDSCIANKTHTLLTTWRHDSADGENEFFLALGVYPSIDSPKIIDIGEDSLIPDDLSAEELRSGMWWRHLVAGAAAGCVSRSCTAPLDRLKVLLQVHGSKHPSMAGGWKYMLAEGGVMSLWRGNGINVFKIAPESAIKFLSYEKIKRLIKGDSAQELHPLQRFAAGSMAGAISQSTIYPMEVMKTRLALRKTGQYNGVLDCASKLLKTEGISCFYRGFVPNLIGIIPYAGIDLCVYETLKRHYMKTHLNGSDPGILILLACGTTSSTCGQICAYPFALIRTKLQAKVSGHRDTMLSLGRHIVRTEGPIGLYRGLTPNFMKVIPAVSISYVIYENVRKALGIEMT